LLACKFFAPHQKNLILSRREEKKNASIFVG